MLDLQAIVEKMLEYLKSEKYYERNFSKQNKKSSAEHLTHFSAEFEALQQWEMTKHFSTKLELTVWKNGLDLTLQTTSDLGLDLNLTPIISNEEEQNAVVNQGHVSELASANGSPGLWNQWLRNCLNSHKRCRELDNKQQLFSPKRLVEIITKDDGISFTWKIIRCADIGYVPYLTLSHCWGFSGHKSLTKENQLKFSEPSDYADLPKSFRHAFFISFSLGFRFIWIDSLCIVQNDPDDWETQASMMGMIYKNACCNVAATWAKDGDGGCFSKRKSKTITLDLGFHPTNQYKINSGLRYYDEILEAPLNERGWVTQERFLARKQLSFAKSQVYWECHELVASEQYPAGIPKHLRDLHPYNQAVSPTGKPTLSQTTDANRRTAWAALVDLYSNCKFSRLSDKMIALAGLAEEMRDSMNDVYLAGMWKNNLQRQLCWSTDCDVRRHFNRSLISTYLAPTWSWVSVNGPVMSDQSYHIAESSVSCVEILNASVHSEHSSKLHSFVSSTLILRGIAIWGRAGQLGNETALEDDDWEIQATGFRNVICCDIKTSFPISIMWDENLVSSEVNSERWPGFLEERSSDLLFLFVHIDPEDSVASGLLLRSLAEATGEVTFVRMGVFRDFGGSLSNLLSVKIGYPTSHSVIEDIDLNDARLEGLIHTITIV